ncbi:MAG TPA: hypothetical protein VNL35_22775 [Chloroflexota bacterium]|nr:hypothetical protein [Chloroflexota bacterium]
MPRPPRRLDAIEVMSFLLSIGVTVVFVWRWPPALQTIRHQYPEFLLCLLISYFPVLAVHEAGHLAAARLVGFRPYAVECGPWRLEWGTDRIHLSTLPRSHWLAGSAVSAPRNGRGLVWRASLSTLGGSAANILCAMLILILLGSGAPDWVKTFLVSWCDLLLVVGLLNLLAIFPSRPGRITDGKRLRLLWSHGGYALAAGWGITNLINTGTRVRDLPPDLVAAACTLIDHGATGWIGRIAAYYWALDRHDTQGADTALAFALAHQPAPPSQLWVILQLEAAYFHARYRGALPQASAYVSAAQPYLPDVPDAFTLRTLAGYYLAAGEIERAIDAAERALRILDAFTGPQSTDDDRDWLNQILADARAALDQDGGRSVGGVTLEPDKENPPW